MESENGIDNDWNLSQPYDPSEFWSQYDEQSRYITDPFIETVDLFLEAEDKLAEQNDIKKRKNIDHDEKIIKKMYGIKEKHRCLMTEEDIIIKNKIEGIFQFMKNQTLK